MKPKILSWNVRGLNDGGKCLRVMRLLRQWKADIVCLQNTELEFTSSGIVNNMWGCPYVEWCYVASSGIGILLMWDKRVVTKLEVCVGAFVAASTFRNVEDDFIWTFARVYGHNLDNDRSLIWEEFADLFSLWALSWCIGGDFNVTHFPS